jgi:hypothetical protein
MACYIKEVFEFIRHLFVRVPGKGNPDRGVYKNVIAHDAPSPTRRKNAASLQC